MGQDATEPAQITSCTVVTEPRRYVLTRDIENSDANVCIDVRASDVYFDGNGGFDEGNVVALVVEIASGQGG